MDLVPTACAVFAGLLLLAACSSGEGGPGDFAGAAGGLATPAGAGSGPVGAAASPAIPGAPGAAGTGAVAPSMPAADSCGNARIEPRAVLVPPRQYVNLLRDLVGPTAVSDQDATASSELEIETIDRPRVTTATLDRYLRLAEHAAETLRGKTGMFLNCPNLTDNTCVRTALGRISHKAFKRPVANDELDGLMALRDMGVQAVADQGETGALAALQAILLSPSTLYRTEFLQPAQGMNRKLSAHERAAALASFVLDSVPDDALLAAADDGSLDTPAGLQTQVDRLLALPRVRQHLTQVVLTAYNVTRIFATPKDTALFPNYTAALQTSMYEETRRFVEDVLWTRKAPLGELMTSRNSFVDGSLAKLYGLPAPSGNGMEFNPVQLGPERAGLLTQPSVMSVLSRTDKNSVVARGLYVRGNILCLPKVASPPDSVQAQVAMQLDGKASQKELAAYRAMTSPCLGCHANFDRFGLLLESFDPIGRHVPAQAEAVDFTGLTPLDGTLSTVGALAERLQQKQYFEQCFADRTLSFALSAASDSKQMCLRPNGVSVPATATMRDLVLAVAQSPAFNDRTQVGP
jgi:Protein of unknown function (DUF1592)/Protein of unknown function (DUF1588)/Protein of unknown function (DUF1595)